MKKLRDRKTGDRQQEVTDDLSEDSQKIKCIHFAQLFKYWYTKLLNLWRVIYAHSLHNPERKCKTWEKIKPKLGRWVLSCFPDGGKAVWSVYLGIQDTFVKGSLYIANAGYSRKSAPVLYILYLWTHSDLKMVAWGNAPKWSVVCGIMLWSNVRRAWESNLTCTSGTVETNTKR